MIKRV
ncbi:uncharacterized protein FFE2_03028 [Fusarium fujikuroi]